MNGRITLKPRSDSKKPDWVDLTEGLPQVSVFEGILWTCTNVSLIDICRDTLIMINRIVVPVLAESYLAQSVYIELDVEYKWISVSLNYGGLRKTHLTHVYWSDKLQLRAEMELRDELPLAIAFCKRVDARDFLRSMESQLANKSKFQ